MISRFSNASAGGRAFVSSGRRSVHSFSAVGVMPTSSTLTVNPAARTNKSSPIYGMPILNVDHAKQVYVIKRGQGKGYSGVENELFFRDNCALVYGDAQKVMVSMIQGLKELG